MRGRLSVGLSAIGLLLVIVASAPFILDTPGPIAPNLLPDSTSYQTHAVLGSVINSLGASPSAAGIQWLKAASHARTGGDIAEAARGIAVARERSGNAKQLDVVLCRIVEHGSPSVWAVADRARLAC